MQEIRETVQMQDAVHELIDRMVAEESEQTSDAFRQRYMAATQRFNQRIEAGEDASLTNKEDRRIGRNDPCPCGSGDKFKKCCGKRIPENDERIAK